MERQILKLYGLSKEDILSGLEKLDYNKNHIEVVVKEKYKDTFMTIESAFGEETLKRAVSLIANQFSKYIYADRDISLYERLYELLEYKHLTVCLSEQATGGIITQNLLTFNGAEKHIKASYILPSLRQTIDHFDINPFKITANRGVCGEIAFDIASQIRARIPADLYVVSLSTLAEGNEMYYNGNEIAYVAIGTTYGVNMMKIENNGGTKRDFMNQVAKSICFKIINILK